MKESTCGWCGTLFLPKKKTQKFCSRQCVLKSIAKLRAEASTRHGLSHTKFYKKYIAILNRCKEKSSHPSWSRYGAKGIRCLWGSFSEFRDDMYKSYLDHVKKYGETKTTIERLESTGHYCKENCIWATPKVQANNTSRNIFITHKGQTKTMTQWSETLGADRNTVHRRIKVYGWSVERALTFSVRKRIRNKKPPGKDGGSLLNL